jgi:hypothetical protein
MPGAVFPEGPAFFRGTFRGRGYFSGRSGAFPGDLPCQGPFFRKVRERVGERVGEKDCTVAMMDPFLTIWHGNIGKKNSIWQGDIGRKFVIPVEIDYFCMVSI